MKKIISSLLVTLYICLFLAARAQDNNSIHKIDSVNATPFAVITADPSTAANTFEKYIPIAVELGHKKGLAKLYANLTLAHYYLGNYDKSTAYSLKSISLYEQVGDMGLMGNQLCETGYMMKRRDLDKAFEYMRRGLSIIRKLGDKNLLARNYNNYGVLHEMKGDIDSALYYYKSGLKYVEEIGDTLGVPYSLNNIFEALLLANKPDSALPYLERTVAMRERRGDELGITENFALYGDYYTAKKNWPKAIEHYGIALERGKEHDYLYLMQYSAQRLSEVYEKGGNVEKALEYYKLQTQYKDSLTNIETNKSIVELEVRFDTEKKEKEIAQQKASLVESAFKLRQRNEMLISLLVLVLFIVLAAYFIYRTQREKQLRLIEENRLKDQLAEVKLLSELQEERLRISRDLHDNIGSQLTFIISSLDNLAFLIGKGEKNVNQRIGNINEFARDTISQFRDTIWAMNKDSISIEDIQARMLNSLTKARETGVIPKVAFSTSIKSAYELNGSQGIHLYRILQEAINNAVKHANATEIEVNFTETTEGLEISLRDNGSGFSQEEVMMGHGLGNMKKRAKELGGTLEINSDTDVGTQIIVRISKNKA